MTRGRSRVLSVFAIVEGLRERHPELQQPLSWPRIQRVFARERIKLLMLPMVDAAADVVGVGPYFVVTLSSNRKPRQHTRDAAHEYGHIKLHASEIGEIDRQLSPCRRNDPRELEARLFAGLLLLGPSATPETPGIADLVAAIAAGEARARMPQQLPLELPEKLPEYKALPQPFEHEREYERGLVARGAKNLRPKGERIFRDPPKPADFDRIKFLDATKDTTRFEDITGRHWWLYNFRKMARGISPAWESVRDFMDPSITHRLFVNSSGVRRLYAFANAREQRAYRVKHLDRQLAQARTLPARARESSTPRRDRIIHRRPE